MTAWSGLKGHGPVEFKCGRTKNSTEWVWKKCPSWNSVSRNLGAWIGSRSFYLDGMGYIKRPRQECTSHKGGSRIIWVGIGLLCKIIHHGLWEWYPKIFWGVTCKSTWWALTGGRAKQLLPDRSLVSSCPTSHKPRPAASAHRVSFPQHSTHL